MAWRKKAERAREATRIKQSTAQADAVVDAHLAQAQMLVDQLQVTLGDLARTFEEMSAKDQDPNPSSEEKPRQ